MEVIETLIKEYKSLGGKMYVLNGIDDVEACRRIMESYLNGYKNGYKKGKEKTYIYE